MPRITATLKELKNADVRYISLVDRAATRIPFRVLKRNEDDTMDLTKIFKGDAKPEVTAVVVRGNADDSQKIVKDAGFAVDKVSKSDGSVVFSQVETQPKDIQLVRLNDNLVVALKGMHGMPTDGSFHDMVAADGFYSGLPLAGAALQASIDKVLSEGTDQKKMASEVETLIEDFRDYASALITNLPVSSFKADVALRVAEDTPEMVFKKMMLDECPDGMDKEKWDAMSNEDKVKHLKSKKSDMEASQAPPATTKETVKETPKDEPKETPKPAPAPTPAPAPAPEPVDKVSKSEIAALLKSISASVAKLDTKVTDLASNQESQKKVVDDLVTKQDALNTKVGSTIVASVRAVETPKADTVSKSEEEDTGYFDTAFSGARKRDRYNKF